VEEEERLLEKLIHSKSIGRKKRENQDKVPPIPCRGKKNIYPIHPERLERGRKPELIISLKLERKELSNLLQRKETTRGARSSMRSRDEFLTGDRS